MNTESNPILFKSEITKIIADTNTLKKKIDKFIKMIDLKETKLSDNKLEEKYYKLKNECFNKIHKATYNIQMKFCEIAETQVKGVPILVDARYEQLAKNQTKVHIKLDTLDSKIDSFIYNRKDFRDLEPETQDFIKRIKKLNHRITALEKAIDPIEPKLDKLKVWEKTIDSRLKKLFKRHANLERAVSEINEELEISFYNHDINRWVNHLFYKLRHLEWILLSLSQTLKNIKKS